MKCTKCEDGYYIKEDFVEGEQVYSCVQVNDQPNCAQFQYISDTHIYCTQCKTGFTLVIKKGDLVGNVEGNNRICLPVGNDIDQNCLEFDKVKQPNGQMVCSKCNANFFLEDNLVKKSVCIQAPAVSDCIEYDIITNLNETYNNV